MNLARPQKHDILAFLKLLPRDSVSCHFACCLPASSVRCIQCPQPAPVSKLAPEELHIWAVSEAVLAENSPLPTESIHDNPC